MARFIDRLAAQPRAHSLWPRRAAGGCLVGLEPWERSTQNQGYVAFEHTRNGNLFRVSLGLQSGAACVCQGVDVCTEASVEDVFADYLLRLRQGDPKATITRSGAGWKWHANGKSREESIATWQAAPGEWGLDQVPSRQR
jgi:hypothetical protein